jgi:hypothetical protein
MKNKIYLLAIATLVFAGCEDFLERKPIGQETVESFLGNPVTAEANFEQMIRACYSTFYASENSIGTHPHHGEWMFGDFLSDDCEKGGNGSGDLPEILDWRRWDITPTQSQRENTVWRVAYTGIGRANTVLDLVEKEDYKNALSPAVYNRIKGEGLFIRGYYFFYLAKVYGSVPYFDSPVLPDQYYDQERMAPELLYAEIEADLAEAASLLLPRDQWTDVWPGGRATKGSAQAVLARVISMEIGFGFNGKTWQDVYDVTNQIITSNVYSLLPNYAMIFETEGEQSSESVFEIQCADLGQAYGAPGGNLQARMTTYRVPSDQSTRRLTTNGWGFTTPSEDLVSQFEAGDPRLPCTVISDGDRIYEDGELSTNEVIDVVENDDCPTGYWARKYTIHPDENPAINTNARNNMRLVRYAEVLLLHAEACYHTSRESEALTAVNEVRDRARASSYPKGSEEGNSGFPAPSTDPLLLPAITSVGAQLLADIKHERRVEMGLEAQRTWDLIRWGEYEDALRNTIIPDDHFLGGEDPNEIVNNYRSHLYDGKVPSFPIPPNEASVYRIEQSPGYN